jgi:hypothetical protein
MVFSANQSLLPGVEDGGLEPELLTQNKFFSKQIENEYSLD